jgi:hypothetical protein
MTSWFIDTGCVPDWAYASAAVVLAFIAWRVRHTWVRTGASG